ncbi:MAG: hypothetical protein WBW34_13940 [Nitrososphaeraceae archaeon]
MDTLDAIIILFIPKAVLATSAAVMNTRILGGPIGPIISGVILQTFLIQVTTDGKEELFTSAVAFNLILLFDPCNSLNDKSCFNKKQGNQSEFIIGSIWYQSTDYLFPTKLPTVNRHFLFSCCLSILPINLLKSTKLVMFLI